MSFVSRRRPLVEAEEKAVQRSSTSGLEPCQIRPHPPAKPALGKSSARLVTPETDQRLLLRGRLYNIRGKSYSEQKPKIPNFPPGTAPRDFSPSCDLPSGNDSPFPEPQSAMPVMSIAAAGDDSPVRVRRRKMVDLWGFQQKDLSTSLIEGGQLQRDEAALLKSKKAAQRKEMQEALSAQIAEKQGKKKPESLGLRASQPIKSNAFLSSVEQIDLSPVLSGSTEDPEHRCFPSPTPLYQPKERLIQLKAVPKANPRIPMPPPEDESMNEFRKLRYPGSNSPERNVFGLNLEGRSDFLYPAEERVSFPGSDEIDRFLGQIGPFPGPILPLRESESPKPGRLSEPSQSVASSFPRHVFGGRNFRRAARKAL